MPIEAGGSDLVLVGSNRPLAYRAFATFHPTFLYECLWDLGVFGILIALDRRFRFGHGRMLALYVMGYTLGRGWIEMLRIDTVELNDVHGLRFNVWTSIVLFVVAAVFFVVSLRRHPGQFSCHRRHFARSKPRTAVPAAGMSKPSDVVTSNRHQ